MVNSANVRGAATGSAATRWVPGASEATGWITSSYSEDADCGAQRPGATCPRPADGAACAATADVEHEEAMR